MESLLVLIFCIAFLIVGVTVFKINPIPILLISALILGVFTGSSVTQVSESIFSGFGNTLKWIGLVIFFGTLLGEILAETGGANQVADSIISVFGTKYLTFSMALVGFIVGIPVFMDVAYLTLLPTIIALAKKTGQSVLTLGLALAMSLTISHALIPPTPGPVAVASLLSLEVGDIIPINMLVGFGAMLIGLAWIHKNKAKFSSHISLITSEEAVSVPQLAGFSKSLPFLALLAPLVLMGLGAIYKGENTVILFIRNPVWSLMIGLCISLFLLKKEGFSEKLNTLFGQAASKCAMVILITGAGGAFGQVIKDSHVVNDLIANFSEISTLGLVLPFLLSFVFTTMTGSITVSLLTTSSIVAPMVGGGHLDPTLTTAAICAGSLGMIHVNSSFFWLFKEIHGFNVPQVLRSFSMLSLVMALGAGLIIGVLSFII